MKSKRFLSFLMALVLCLSLLPLGAFADEAETVEPEAEIIVAEETSEESSEPAVPEEPAESEETVVSEETAEEIPEEASAAEEISESAQPAEPEAVSVEEETEESTEAADTPEDGATGFKSEKAEGVLQYGDLYDAADGESETLEGECEDGTASSATRTKAFNRIKNALLNFEETIYMGDLYIYEYEASDIFWAVVNSTAELFYVYDNITWSWEYSSYYGYCYTEYFYPTYDYFGTTKISTLKSMSSEMKSAAKTIVAGVDSDWSTVGKVLYIHDYLVTHTDYDQSLTYYDAYACLVGHKCVCQAYAMAYKYLLGLLGIECKTVTSKELNHAWNMVTIGGKNYFVDCTWDDPTGMYSTYCLHENFLLSPSAFWYIGHDSNDWIIASGENVRYTGSSTYDEAFWRDSTSPVAYANGSWYCCDYMGDVYTFYPSSGKVGKLCFDNDNLYGSLAVVYGKLLISGSNAIYYWNGKTATVVDRLSSSCTETIYDMSGSSRKLIYCTRSGPSSGNSATAHSVNIVSYNANGGSGIPYAGFKPYGKAFTISSYKPTRDGYTFTGWATSSTATTAQYKPGKTYTSLAGFKLYAVWLKGDAFEVTYNSNGGSGAPSSAYKIYGKSFTISSTKPTRNGYTFLGWSTSKSATTAKYKAGYTYSSLDGTTLYAVWQKASYFTITFNANGGSGGPTTGKKYYGKTYTIPSTKPTRSGYTFLGWATSKSATTATYKAGYSYSSINGYTLYAVWQKK